MKSIKADKVNNSVYVQVEQQGTGKQADSGQLVGVKYNGYSFEGKYFDSNIDTAKQSSPHGLDTFFFVAKQEGAIQGMLEGITVFKKGGKGKTSLAKKSGSASKKSATSKSSGGKKSGGKKKKKK